MSDFLQTATAWLGSTLKASAGQAVIYTRKNVSISVTATIGQTDAEKETDAGARIVFRTVDFLIAPADLVISGATITPERGDRITWNGGIYEVMPLNNEPHEVSGGPYRTFHRIHTKKVSP